MIKWLHTIGSIAVAVIAIASPALQSVIVAHPEVSGTLAAIYAILGQFAPHADPAAGLPQTKTESQSEMSTK